MAIRQQKKLSSLAIVPGIRMDLNPLSQVNGSARILRNFIPERGRLIRKAFSPDYIVPSLAIGEGPNNPSAFVGGTWTNPSNVATSNDVYATSTDPTTQLYVTGFSFTAAIVRLPSINFGKIPGKFSKAIQVCLLDIKRW